MLLRERRLRLSAFGIATEPGKSAHVLLSRHERLPLPARYLASEEAAERLRAAIEMAEDVGRQAAAVRQWFVWLAFIRPFEEREFETVRKAKDYRDKARTSQFKRLCASLPLLGRYWWRLDEEFTSMMERLAEDEEGDGLREWSAVLRGAAQSALREAIRGLAPSGRVLRAGARAEDWLNGQLGRVLALE